MVAKKKAAKKTGGKPAAKKSVLLRQDQRPKGEASHEDARCCGGKGANLADMTSIGLPVPPGFTITTDTCAAYYKAGQRLPTA
jgi:pyruvate,orthophosphate dikinase